MTNTPAPAPYNATMMARRSTEWLTAKVAELTPVVERESRGSYARSSYHAQMGREQRAKALRTYRLALADREAGILPYTPTTPSK